MRMEQMEQQAQMPQQQAGGQQGGGGNPMQMAAMQQQMGGQNPSESSFRRYKVNVLVDNGETEGAPVVYEDNPTLENLIGRTEYVAQFGALQTDFNLIRDGALHRANGGYLVLDARKVLMNRLSWEQLKRALFSDQIKIESTREIMGLAQTVSLEPEPIPLDVKIVLIGGRRLYYLLSQHDPEFSELFKVSVDFEEEMDRTDESTDVYAEMIATHVDDEELRPFDASAVGRVMARSSRIAEDKEKLTTRDEKLKDLLREADYWAGEAGRETVHREDVQQAIDAYRRRNGRIEDKMQEYIDRETILIDTEGEEVGQINGLSVLKMDDFSFGRPNRITARTRMGSGEVVDIEREVELGGPIHSKGVLILSGFLGARYAEEQPLSLSASLVFEQSYGGIEGDSASVAEACALLSALSDVPIRQDMAITGSMNQHGRVQAIGGANDKIEGFFEVCESRGLTGDQGVVIPQSNVKNLMLSDRIVDAVEAGDFHIYAAETIDDAIELMMDTEAGEVDAEGTFPEGTVNRLVHERLSELAEKAKQFAADSDDE
jgi:lon-related putative ATP-dependent protease